MAKTKKKVYFGIRDRNGITVKVAYIEGRATVDSDIPQRIQTEGRGSVTPDNNRMKPRQQTLYDPAKAWPLPHIERHSPTGFEWGYHGSGPADLALSILVDHFNDRAKAELYYQPFKSTVVARFRRNAWQITTDEIRAAIRSLYSEEGLY